MMTSPTRNCQLRERLIIKKWKPSPNTRGSMISKMREILREAREKQSTLTMRTKRLTKQAVTRTIAGET